jgi:hypothetical protein
VSIIVSMSLDFAECDRARLARDHLLVFSASSQVRTQSITSASGVHVALGMRRVASFSKAIPS